MQKQYVINVKGKVQGVYYRQSTVETARQLGLSGFVQNESNGDVYVEAQGEEEQLKKLVEWCKVGSPLAHVSKIIVTEAELKKHLDFIIRK